jgi:hypothetical protein
MTEQTNQIRKGVRTEKGSTKPYAEIAGPPGQVFQVMSLSLEFDSGIGVYKKQSRPSGGAAQPPSQMVSCFGVEFHATVRFAGDAGWKIGWVQTVESSDFWVLYRGGGRAARFRTKLPGRQRDSDTRKGCWFGDESREKASSAEPVTLDLMDDPNIPFHYPQHPGGTGLAADLAGLAPAQCGGQMEFWTWLAAVREGPGYQPLDVVYLHHMHWKVVFDGTIHGGGADPGATFPDGSGVVLLGEGTGQGTATPVFDGPGGVEQFEVFEVEKLPDGQPQ